MTEPVVTMDDVPAPAATAASPDRAAAWDGPEGWQRLPQRAFGVFVVASLVSSLIPGGILSLILRRLFIHYHHGQYVWTAIAAGWVLIVLGALWIAFRRYRYTNWRLDTDGFAVRRGRLWLWETQVPTSRVQHLDIKRGPLERMQRLASLVLHTAGTRLGGVHVSGLDETVAERLREHFSREIERQASDDDDRA